jgi:hypothetical protein
MPLQNRVDPWGRIHAVPARGLFTGNRGVIHDPARRVLLNRAWASRAWLICACRYKDRPPRDVMGYNGRKGGAGWTELFFLDEVSALAAGHRPCFFCRREAAKDFMARFALVSGIGSPKVADLDSRLHAERLASDGRRMPLDSSAIEDLPEGTMLCRNGEAFARRGAGLLRWSFAGWSPGEPRSGGWSLITPATTIAILARGYRPVWHDSALT